MISRISKADWKKPFGFLTCSSYHQYQKNCSIFQSISITYKSTSNTSITINAQ